MKKICIRFGDNDFLNTFRGVMECLYNSHLHAGPLPADKEKLCSVINGLAPMMYVLYQNRWEYNGMRDGLAGGMEFVRVSEYLTVGVDMIYLDGEVDAVIASGGEPYGFNMDFHVLDTTLHNNNIYTL